MAQGHWDAMAGSKAPGQQSRVLPPAKEECIWLKTGMPIVVTVCPLEPIVVAVCPLEPIVVAVCPLEPIVAK